VRYALSGILSKHPHVPPSGSQTPSSSSSLYPSLHISQSATPHFQISLLPSALTQLFHVFVPSLPSEHLYFLIGLLQDTLSIFVQLLSETVNSPFVHFAVIFQTLLAVVVFTPVLAPFDNAGIEKLQLPYVYHVAEHAHDGNLLQLLPL
jgi:hypothetical protein